MKRTIEEAIKAKRFSLPALRDAVWPLLTKHPSVCTVYPTISSHFTDTIDALANAIVRHVFLIEPVKNEKVGTTKYSSRWNKGLEKDPRWCSFDECLLIASDLFNELCGGWLATAVHAEAVKLSFETSLVPHEVPLDYVSRPLPGDPEKRIHRRGNLKWTCTDSQELR